MKPEDERRVWSDHGGLVHLIKPFIHTDMNGNEYVGTWYFLCGGKTLSGHAPQRDRDRDAIPSCLACIGARQQ